MQSVAERIAARVAREGAIPFAVFMAEALYGEGGYYRRERWPVGAGGDFVTGPALSPLLARATARLLARLDGRLGRPAELLEVGYGDGAHLAEIARSAAAGRRLRGVDRAGRPLPPPVQSLPDLSVLAAGEIEGVILSCELFDALPVHRLVGTDEGVEELWVVAAPGGGFAWQRRPLSDPRLRELVERAGATLAPEQVADLSLDWEPLYRELAARLGRGLLVTFDYGFAGRRLYDARIRRHGTLACHRRHRLHRDALAVPGEQDLTAHVDFDLLRRSGEEEGLVTVGLVSQALWLAACGLFSDLAGAPPARRHEAMALLDPEGMGSEIRVLVQARGVDVAGLFDLPLGAPHPVA
ncbi:MAG: SAM-dependent methyltransferase [Thermoanaerobaculia bacterium]|nr:SAM-dependent methyltransferase [Thermoanaerobaculia bacterium]